jgi:hypothetical protein
MIVVDLQKEGECPMARAQGIGMASFVALLMFTLSACGGGNGNSAPAAATSPPPPTPALLVRTHQLSPASATVGPTEKVTLKAIVCESVEFGDSNEILLATCNPDGSNVQTVPASDWSINGVVGGAAATGTIQPGDTTNTSAVYTAPPLPCPSLPVEVEVSARIDARTLLKAKVTTDPSCGGPPFQPFPGYQGTTSWANDILGDDADPVSGNAQVTWELASVTGRVARYHIKSGTYMLGPLSPFARGCTTRWSITSVEFSATISTAELEVDFTPSPPLFKINAQTTVPGQQQITTCPFPASPPTIPVGYPHVWSYMPTPLTANADASMLNGKDLSSVEPNPGQVITNETNHSYQAIRTTQ